MNKKIDLKSLPPKWFAVSIVFVKGETFQQTISMIVSRDKNEAFQCCFSFPEYSTPVLDGFRILTKSALETDFTVSAEDVQKFYEAIGEDKP